MSVPSLFTVPLACGSFVFFRATKRVLHRLRTARDRRRDGLDWRTLSEVLSQRLALPYIMVSGPRWNPHALIAQVGPFQVQHELRLQVDTAQRSAQMWTLIIYHAKDLSTVAAIDSHAVARDTVWHVQPLPPGRYSGVLRYYEWGAAPRLPVIELDGTRRIPERSVPPNENAYLDLIRGKDNAFFRCLHYYVLEMLRRQRHLPESFVRREYLPVGNPETAYLFGYLRPRQGLEIRSDDGIAEGHRLYCTLYNHSSFPVVWSEVRSFPFRTEPIATTGSYLLRLQATRASQAPPSWPASLQAHVWDLPRSEPMQPSAG